jgi:hypothetical protein
MIRGNLISVVGVLFLAFTINACGEKKTHSSIETLETEAFTNSQELNQVLNRWKVECASTSSCPSSVGQILITDGKLLGLCTGTLVESRYVLTNSHCFNIKDPNSNEMISPDRLCQSGTRIVFASNSREGHSQLFCHRVVKKSELKGSEPLADYLVFEVKNSEGRRSDKISRQGLPSKEKLTLRKVNPLRRGFGNLVTAQCQVIHSTVLAPSSNNVKQDIHVLGGCDSVQGNSGSSLVDSEGNIRAILFKGFVNSFQASLTSFQLEVRNKALKLKTILVTNLSCMEYLFENEDKNSLEGCTPQHKSQGTLYDSLKVEEVKKVFEMQKLFLTQGLEESTSFGQSLKFVENDRSFYNAPVCLLKSVTSPGTQFLNLLVLTPVFAPEIGINDNLTTFVRGFNKDTRACSITLAPRQFFLTGRGNVKLAGPGCVNSQGILRQESDDTWSLCPSP